MRFRGVICLLFVVCMITSPLMIAVEANFALAQPSPTFSGELLQNPYFTEEPYVEIGQYSPEFEYEYTAGSVALIWIHSAGYELDYSYYFPSSCLEYARVMQTFESSYNESIASVKIAASIRLDCTGDFAAEDTIDNLWEVNFGIYRSVNTPNTIRTISDLKNGDTEEIEFMLSELETLSYFYGPEIPEERGLSLQLTPTPLFAQPIGNVTPWMDYSGSVILTITHMSFEVMLEGDNNAPPLRFPIYNTTLLSNETDLEISGIESAGNDQIYQFCFDSNNLGAYSIFTLSSNHQELRNRTVHTNEPYSDYSGIYNFAVGNDRIAMLGIFNNGTISAAHIQCLDSFGNFYWNTTVNLYSQDIPIAASFDESGNVLIYILSIDSQTSPYDSYYQELIGSLVKLDNLGNEIWNKTLDTQTYWEYISGGGFLIIPRGLGCVGNDIFIGLGGNLIKLDLNGEELWNIPYPIDAMCVDPQGGLYTFARIHQSRTELTRWNTNGNSAWTKSLGWEYGNGWTEYPNLHSMTVGPNGPLHIVLEYNCVHSSVVLVRITRTGDLLSEDTIFIADQPDEDMYEFVPTIPDITVTEDGLVHILGTYNYPGYIGTPFTIIPGKFMVTYEFPGIITISPISLTMVGVASVLIIGIAYDFFFRQGKGVPEPPTEPSISDFEW